MLSLRQKIWIYRGAGIFGCLYFFSLPGRASVEKGIIVMIALGLFLGITPYFITCPNCKKSIYQRKNSPLALLVTAERVCSRCDTKLL